MKLRYDDVGALYAIAAILCWHFDLLVGTIICGVLSVLYMFSNSE